MIRLLNMYDEKNRYHSFRRYNIRVLSKNTQNRSDLITGLGFVIYH